MAARPAARRDPAARRQIRRHRRSRRSRMVRSHPPRKHRSRVRRPHLRQLQPRRHQRQHRRQGLPHDHQRQPPAGVRLPHGRDATLDQIRRPPDHRTQLPARPLQTQMGQSPQRREDMRVVRNALLARLRLLLKGNRRSARPLARRMRLLDRARMGEGRHPHRRLRPRPLLLAVQGRVGRGRRLRGHRRAGDALDARAQSGGLHRQRTDVPRPEPDRGGTRTALRGHQTTDGRTAGKEKRPCFESHG